MKKFEVDFYDYSNGATSPIGIIIADDNYTAEDYVRDCEHNADDDWCEMLKGGRVTLVEVEFDGSNREAEMIENFEKYHD